MGVSSSRGARWTEGYTKRFGLYHVGFGTQKRTPKRTALFYADVIRSGGKSMGDARRTLGS